MNLPFGFQIVRTKSGSIEKTAGLTGRYPKDAVPLDDEFYTTVVNDLLSGMSSKRDLLLFFYLYVSEVSSIVNYIAQKGADIPFKHVRVEANGKKKDLGRTDYIKILENPNFLVNGSTHMKEAIVSYLIYGFIPVNIVDSVGWEVPNELFLFPGNQFYAIPQRTINRYGKPSPGIDYRLNKISKYRLFIDNKYYDFDPREMIVMSDTSMNYKDGEYLLGKGRLYPAIRSIQSLSNIYDTINTLLSNKGAAGFVVKRSRSGEVDSGWDPDDKKEVERRLYTYGTTGSRRPIAVTSKDLGFVRLSVPVNDFIPIELKESDFRTLSSALMFPSVLLNDKQGAIYNNVSLAEKAFYTNCLMPIVNMIYQAYTIGFGLSDRNEKLVADWEGIAALQKDMKTEAEGNKVWNEVFEKLWQNDMITRNQWLEQLGMPRINKPEYDMYRTELNQQGEEESEQDQEEDTQESEENSDNESEE